MTPDPSDFLPSSALMTLILQHQGHGPQAMPASARDRMVLAIEIGQRVEEAVACSGYEHPQAAAWALQDVSGVAPAPAMAHLRGLWRHEMNVTRAGWPAVFALLLQEFQVHSALHPMRGDWGHLAWADGVLWVHPAASAE